jgi:hypothetical protein
MGSSQLATRRRFVVVVSSERWATDSSLLSAHNVADTTSRMLSVEGMDGSFRAFASSLISWRKHGDSANVAFRNGATRQLQWRFQSGCQCHCGSSCAHQYPIRRQSEYRCGESTASITLNVQGRGSTVIQSGASTLIVRHWAATSFWFAGGLKI